MYVKPNQPHASWLTDILLQLKFVSNKEKKDSENVDVESLYHEAIALALRESERLRMNALMPYFVPVEILRIKQHPFGIYSPPSEELMEGMARRRTDESIYIKAFTEMIHLEEAAQSAFLTHFNQQNMKFEYTGDGREFRIKIEKRLSRMVEAINESILDCFTLYPAVTSPVRTSISGQIRGISKDYIFVEISEERIDYFRCNCTVTLFDIYFHMNRMTFQLQHKALEWIRNHKLFDLLINNPKYDEFPVDVDGDLCEQNYEFGGKLALELNEEQKIAVMNIAKARNAPLPYLIFGPAGTGKTATLVAAIEEIVRSSANFVLVCANSNAACDEITERLVNVLHFGELFRMYSRSYDAKKISEKIKPICNWIRNEFRFPSLTFLYEFRVLVCTLATVGCITRAREDSAYNPKHFSHIIIDECASTHETVSLIPIGGLCTSYRQIYSSIVLAGDPKQLDAVTKSKCAAERGYETSLMEQLFNRRLYQRNSATGKFNQKYITQLVKNYRSHSAILHVPNALFYENMLEAKASADITDWFIGSNLLPSKKFPMIFKSVQGSCKRSEQDFSMSNAKEIDVVMDYIRLLLMHRNKHGKQVTQQDIGVVTPYRLQCKLISRRCRQENFKDITIGTAEVFQGQQRPIMIITTVRIGGILGFVKNPRRFNVICTRAESLLIIVGDPHTLCADKNWRALIEYCIQNDAFIQGDKPFSITQTSCSDDDELNKQFSLSQITN